MLDFDAGRVAIQCDGVSGRQFLRLGALTGAGLTLPALGIEYTQALYTPQNQPVPILPECEQAHELWN